MIKLVPATTQSYIVQKIDNTWRLLVAVSAKSTPSHLEVCKHLFAKAAGPNLDKDTMVSMRSSVIQQIKIDTAGSAEAEIDGKKGDTNDKDGDKKDDADAKKDKKGGRKTAAGKISKTVTKTKKKTAAGKTTKTKSKLEQPQPPRVLSAVDHICSLGIDDQSPDNDDTGDDDGVALHDGQR